MTIKITPETHIDNQWVSASALSATIEQPFISKNGNNELPLGIEAIRQTSAMAIVTTEKHGVIVIHQNETDTLPSPIFVPAPCSGHRYRLEKI